MEDSAPKGPTHTDDSDKHQTNGQIVVDSQPESTSGLVRDKLSESQELRLLGLRPNSESQDPCNCCFACIFCLEVCMSGPGAAAAVPPVSLHKKKKDRGGAGGYWDEGDGGDISCDNDDGFEWAVTLANTITGHDGGHHSSPFDSGDGDGGCDGGDGGGDGGGCGGGDGGGGE